MKHLTIFTNGKTYLTQQITKDTKHNKHWTPIPTNYKGN